MFDTNSYRVKQQFTSEKSIKKFMCIKRGLSAWPTTYKFLYWGFYDEYAYRKCGYDWFL